MLWRGRPAPLPPPLCPPRSPPRGTRNTLRRPARAGSRRWSAARRAAPGGVDESLNRALLVARHDHRRVAHPGGAEVARIGDLGFQAQVAPRRAAEDALHLQLVDRRIVVQPERHAGVVVAGPGDVRGHDVLPTTLRSHFLKPRMPAAEERGSRRPLRPSSTSMKKSNRARLKASGPAGLKE